MNEKDSSALPALLLAYYCVYSSQDRIIAAAVVLVPANLRIEKKTGIEDCELGFLA